MEQPRDPPRSARWYYPSRGIKLIGALFVLEMALIGIGVALSWGHFDSANLGFGVVGAP